MAEELESERFARIAKAIEDDSEWFTDDTIDDADLITALTIAAETLRQAGR